MSFRAIAHVTQISGNDRFSERFWEAIGGGDEGAIARVAQNLGGDQSSMGERSPLQISEGKREVRSLILPKFREAIGFLQGFGRRSV